MVDPTRRKLRIPNWYSPYLEKFRIYELFHELARELVIQEPADHVLFLKEILYNASASRYAPRIVLLGPPEVNLLDIAQIMNEKCRATVITEHDFLAAVGDARVFKHRPRVSKMTDALLQALRSDNTYYTGWILPDYPKKIREAKAMLKVGIMPTHVFQLILPFTPDIYNFYEDRSSPPWLEYRRKILAMRETFKHHLIEIYMGSRNSHQIVNQCIDLLNIRKRYNSPIIPRVCLLGPRGSGRKTQAKKIAQTFNLIHVDFEYLLCQHWISETHLGCLLRAQRDKVGSNSLLLTAVVHKRILDFDCLEKGWILTGFPNTLEDLKNLDMIDTPPNRIIFLEVDLDQCRARVTNRRVNMYSGSVTNLIHNLASADDPILRIHPKDRKETINSELKYYCENYEAMRKYCGRTSNIVDGNQIIQWVTENVAALLMRPLPECDPRTIEEYDDYVSGSDTNDSSIECVCIPPCENPFEPENAQTFDGVRK